MDPIEEIDSTKRRGLEATQRISSYLRTSAKKEAKRTSAEPKSESVPQSEADKLDFSSEFTNQNLDLSDHDGFPRLMDWDDPVDEEPESNEEEGSPSGGGGEAEGGSTQEGTEGEAPVDPSADEPAPHLVASSGSEEESSTKLANKEAEDQAAADGPSVSAREVGADDEPTTSSVAVSADQPRQASDVPVDTEFPGSPTQTPEPEVLELSRIRPAPSTPLPATGRLDGLAPELVSTIGRLIKTPEAQAGYEECVRLLARFGLGAARICVRAKVTVEILDEVDFLSHPDLLALRLKPEETPTDGAYLVGKRLVLVDRRCLLGRPRFFHPALYYFAHAFDHAQGGEVFSSRKAAAVVACFEASTRATTGFDFVDELAAADPVRYFARSVAVHLGCDDCSEPLWARQDMMDFDRAMHDYLAYLFARLAV